MENGIIPFKSFLIPFSTSNDPTKVLLKMEGFE